MINPTPVPSEKGIRSFIAIDIPENVSPVLTSIQQAFRKRFAKVPASWVRISHIHLTLKFLGSVPSDRMDALRNALGFIRVRKPFELSLEQVGFFPDAAKARILWCGYKKSQPLNSLQQEIEEILFTAGFPREDKPFVPHVTLARFKVVPRGAATALHEIVRSQKVSAVHTVNAIVLYQSVLRPQGAEYSVIESCTLGG